MGSKIETAHNGDLEAIRREIERLTVGELAEKYHATISAVFAWERKFGVSAARICVISRTQKQASLMRRTKRGQLRQICQACEPPARRPGQPGFKTSDRERTLQEYTDMPAIMYRFLRARLTRRTTDERPFYWPQGALE